MPIHLSGDLFGAIVHALFAGLVAIRYLWPVWLVIAVLWLATRIMRAIGRFLGFSGAAAKTTKPVVRPRR